MSILSKDGRISFNNYDEFTGQLMSLIKTDKNWRGKLLNDTMVNDQTIIKSNGKLIPPGYWKQAGIAHLNAASFGCKNDGDSDDSEMFARAIQVADEEGLPLLINRGMGIRITEELKAPATLQLIGSNPYGPLNWRTQPNPKTDQNPMCRIKFDRPDGALFEPAEKQADGYGNLKLVLHNVGITYRDFYLADSNNQPSSVAFKNVSLSGHSSIQNSQINTFNTAFASCSFGAGVKCYGNVFRELGEGFIRNSIVGDCFIFSNYINGSVQAINGAVGIEATNMNMAIILGNWFEFLNTGITAGAGSNVIIAKNIIDYTRRPIEGFGFQATIDGNATNHCNKVSVLGDPTANPPIPGRLRRVDADHPMRTEEWISINIPKASRAVTITNNIGQGSEKFIQVGSTGSYSHINTSGNAATDRLSVPLEEDKLIELVKPGSGSIGKVSIQELMWSKLSELPSKNVFNNRVIVLNGMPLIYNQDRGAWTDFKGDMIDFGGLNLLPGFKSPRWTKPGNGITATEIGKDGFTLRLTVNNTNRAYAHVTSYVQGDDILLNSNGITSSSTSSSRQPIAEIRLFDFNGAELTRTTFPSTGSRLVEVSKMAIASQVKEIRTVFGGSGSAEVPVTYTFKNVQLLRKIAGSYSLNVWDNEGNPYPATSFDLDQQLDKEITGKWNFVEGIQLTDSDGSVKTLKLVNGQLQIVNA